MPTHKVSTTLHCLATALEYLEEALGADGGDFESICRAERAVYYAVKKLVDAKHDFSGPDPQPRTPPEDDYTGHDSYYDDNPF